jgi:hypothetical protein
VSRKRFQLIGGWASALLLTVGLAALAGQYDRDSAHEAIRYMQTASSDPVARLQKRLAKGETRWAYDPQRGYLPALLQELNVPVSSQMLVFSKTSFQRDRISPQTPRAIYYNDQVYAGWVPGGPVIEITAVDPQLGAVFYTLSQERSGKPKITRQTHECLQCHESGMTAGVPGHLIRSVYSDPQGQPILSAGSFVTTHQSPLRERWGGWYVTGTHGRQRHLGNLTFTGTAKAEKPNRDAGANIADLRRRFLASLYLSRHSDIVALMVCEHQTYLQNLLTQANYQTRIALDYERRLNRELGRPEGTRWESAIARIRSVNERLLQGLLFAGEPALTDPVRGTSGFEAQFPRPGPRDRQGRSLRDLDLKRRLFRYPCSYLIHSEAFEELPSPAKEYIFTRLLQILNGEDRSKTFAHLSAEDRRAILEILLDTHRGFSQWKASQPTAAPEK